MRLLHVIRLRLRSLFSRRKLDADLDEELRYHLDRETEDALARGVPVAEIPAGLEQRKEECRDARGWNLLDKLTQDVRFSIRQLRKNPGFTATAIIMLALGICSSVTIFALVDAALIKPLPYKDPARLVAVFETTRDCPLCNVSYLNFRDWQRNGPGLFQSLEAWGFSTYLLRTPQGAEPARGARVSDGFFRTLGVEPVLGRGFFSGQDAPGAPHTVLISFSAWQNRFGGRRDIVGHSVTLSGVPHTIIGVLPRGFQFALRGPAEFWAPLNDPTSCEARRTCHSLFALARLKDGVSLESSLSAMTLMAQRLARQYPDSNRGSGAQLLPLSEAVSGNLRPVLLVLLGGAALLLLIACINVSSLVLVRSEGRRRELAVRSALGASRARIVLQFVTEGLVLVAAGSTLGLALAYWTAHLLVGMMPADKTDFMPFLLDLAPNPRVLAFAAAISLAAAILFALMPTLLLPISRPRDTLAEGSRGSAGTAWRRFGSKLVVLELATAVVLLVGAGLLGKSLYLLLHVNTGLQPEHLATLLVTIPDSYQTGEQVAALERLLLERIENLPGVKSAGISTSLPLSGWGMDAYVVVPGRPSSGTHNEVAERDVSAGYLRTLEARLIRGRYFTATEDDPLRPAMAVVNREFAAQYFPGQNPVGRQFSYEITHQMVQIVGVVDDVREGDLDTASRPAIYVPFTQGWFRSFGIVVRTAASGESLLSGIAASVHQVDQGIATDRVMTMSDVLDTSPSAYVHRSSAWLVGAFASLALLLSVVGLYGVVAYSVSQRTREVGIRMALGADRALVYRLIMKEGGWLTLAGITLGLAVSVAAAALMRNLLFGVQAWDVPTLAGVAVTLGLSALLATYLPARRAASVNPVEALRSE